MAGYSLRGLCRKGAEPLMRWLMPAVRLSETVTYSQIAGAAEEEVGHPKDIPDPHCLSGSFARSMSRLMLPR
jgi:hypothetical protein